MRRLMLIEDKSEETAMAIRRTVGEERNMTSSRKVEGDPKILAEISLD